MKEKLIIFLISVVVVIGLAVGLLVGEQQVMTIIDKERQSNYSFMGQAAAEAETRADTWYRSMFVDSGMTAFSFNVTSSPDTPNTHATGAAALADKGMAWWRSRMRVLWSITYQFLVRISTVLVWVPLALLVFVPFVVDAMVLRKIKSTNFSITSPHVQLFGIKALMWLPLAFFVLQLMPFALHPVWTPITIGLLSGASWVGISHFAKRA